MRRLALLLGAGWALLAAGPGVPEPDPAATSYRVGAFYFPGWKPGVHAGWGKIAPYPNRIPLLGFYDGSNPEVADWEIKWALEHGISYFVYCWYRGRGVLGKPVTADSLFLGHGLHEALFRSRFVRHFGFAIMFENLGSDGFSSPEDLLDNVLPFWIEQYFRKPEYLRIGGRPALFVYNYRKFVESAGGEEGARNLSAAMQERCRKAGLRGLLILSRGYGKTTEGLRRSGAEAMFSYGLLPKKTRPTPREAIEDQAAAIRDWGRAGVPFVPTAMMGSDSMPWAKKDPRQPWYDPEKMHRYVLAPEQYEILLRRVKAEMDRFPATHPGRRVIVLSHWNEWGEGAHLAPHQGAGFGYLNAIRAVFTNGRNRPDHRSPFEVGLGPYGPDQP